MNRSEILKKVNEICADVFDDEELTVTDTTTAEDVEEWDSLTHLQLMSEIETEFQIKFTLGEIQGFANVGELVDTIRKRIS